MPTCRRNLVRCCRSPIGSGSWARAHIQCAPTPRQPSCRRGGLHIRPKPGAGSHHGPLGPPAVGARMARPPDPVCKTVCRLVERPLRSPMPCGKLSVRQHLSVSLRLTAPLKGSLFLRRRTLKPPLEGRWHGEAVTERCAAAQRRRRVSALCTRRNPATSLRCGNTSQSACG